MITGTSFKARRVRWRVLYVMTILSLALGAAIYSFVNASPEMISGLPPYSGNKIGVFGSIIYRGAALAGASVVIYLIHDFIVDFPNPKPILIISEDGVWIRNKMRQTPVPWKLIKGYNFDKATQNYGFFRLSWKYLEIEATNHEPYMRRFLWFGSSFQVYTYNLDKREDAISEAIDTFLNSRTNFGDRV